MIAPNGLRAKLAVHPIATPPTREEKRRKRERRRRENGID